MDWFEFILARYNYWIVIVLMMTGLYIVYARGNLVKKVVGLNLFQTSVFIFYITIGKIAGGTAPIYIGGELDHGGGHGGDDENGHDAAGDHGESLHDAPATDHGAEANEIESASELHSKIENTFASNDLKAGLNELNPPEDAPETAEEVASLHEAPVSETGKITNDALANLKKPEAPGFEVAGEHSETAAGVDLHAADSANALSDVVHHTSEVIYTNPLPHVLILTAIVVGVATTAVGLALAVRIREAYGTIEEDELEAIDNVAEFGEGSVGAGAAS